MKLKERMAFVAAGGLLVLLWHMPMASSEDVEPKNPLDDISTLGGAEPYTPTKIEWLVLNLQVGGSEDFGSDGIAINFIRGTQSAIIGLRSRENTVVVSVLYLPRASRERVNLKTVRARGSAEMRAAMYGWDWVKIREDVKIWDVKMIK